MTQTITSYWLEGIKQDFHAPIEAKVFGPYPDNTWDVELYIGQDVMATVTLPFLDNILEDLAPHIATAKTLYNY